MADIKITMDANNPDRFLIITNKDVSLFGYTQKEKFEHYYYMDISPWNLSDLFSTCKEKLGYKIEYDPLVLPIIENLRNEIKVYKEAALIKTLSIDDINDLWEEQGFPFIFPKIQADMHQKRAVLWALKVKRSGMYLEQGTGKTPVGIFILGKLLYDGLVHKPLVFAPVSLLGETAWFGDLREFSDIEPLNLRDTDSLFCYDRLSLVNFDKLQHWCFKKTKTAEHSYDKSNFFEMQKFDAIYYDEASTLRGHNSYRTQAFLKICKYAKYMSLASGTPAPNKIFQIWGQMKAIGSVLGDSYIPFEQRYGVQRSTRIGMKWFPRFNAEQEIRRRIDLVSYFIKRSDVYDMPKRHFITVDIDLHPDHLAFYKKIEKDYIAAIQGLDENGDLIEGKLRVLHEQVVRIRLLQIANGFTIIEDKNGKHHKSALPWNAKLDKLDEIVRDYLSKSEDNYIIIWCSHRWEIETIYKKYEDIASYIYGGLTDKKREELLSRWKNDKKCRLIVAMPSAAKYGHTWLKAKLMIYYSATEDFDNYAQSHDRNYRRGQDEEVTEMKLVAVKTIERKVWVAVQNRKRVDQFLKDYYKGQIVVS